MAGCRHLHICRNIGRIGDIAEQTVAVDITHPEDASAAYGKTDNEEDAKTTLPRVPIVHHNDLNAT